MGTPIANTSNTNTWGYLINRLNEVTTAMSNIVVTVNTAPTVGNSTIYGTFSANTINANTLGAANVAITGTFTANTLVLNDISTGTLEASANLTYSSNTIIHYGNSTSNSVMTSQSLSFANASANIALTLPTGSQIANGAFYLSANSSWVPIPYNPISNNSTNTVGTTTQVIDSWPLTTYGAAEYILHVNDLVANNRYTSHVLAFHNISTATLTEYAQITSNSNVGLFTASVNATSFILQFTPTSTSNFVKYTRVLV